MAAGRDQLKPMQRLVRIMAVLDQAGTNGATRGRLIDVADYGDKDPGSQLALDLKHLRNQGWQIDSIGGQGEAGVYRMVPGDNRLRLRLSPEQRGALQRAVLLADRAALAKNLGVAEADVAAGIGSRVAPRAATPELSHALEAVRLRCRIRFSYKGTDRSVSPSSVRLQNQAWYLSGVEDGQAGQIVVKHFVVGRMSRTELDRPGSADPVPEVRRLDLHPLLWEVDPPIRVVVRTPADFVPDVERWLRPPDAAVPGDGTVDLTYTVTNRASFRARLYTLGTRVGVVRPDEFRDEMLAELRELAGEA